MTGIPKQGPVIAIDGPAGTGKSSATKKLADLIGFVHVDTGAIYRTVALLTLECCGADFQQDVAVQIARNVHLEFRRDPNRQPTNRILADGRDVTAEIRTAEVSMGASKVSAIPGVRAALLGLQRRLGCAGWSVLEGRDIGTVVFPDADVKFFLTASVEERTKRRFLELQQAGKPVSSFEDLRRQIEQRDLDDASRSVAPLRKADDAYEVDTTKMSLEEVVRRMESVVRERLGSRIRPSEKD